MGFVRSPVHDELWTPCLRYALPQDSLCLSHLEGLEGSILGLASLQSQQRFRHVIDLQHRSRIVRERKLRRGAAIEGERAVRESYPHLEKALREIFARRHVVGLDSNEGASEGSAQAEGEGNAGAGAESNAPLEKRAEA
jgi:hypothetical protein